MKSLHDNKEATAEAHYCKHVISMEGKQRFDELAISHSAQSNIELHFRLAKEGKNRLRQGMSWHFSGAVWFLPFEDASFPIGYREVYKLLMDLSLYNYTRKIDNMLLLCAFLEECLDS